MDNDVLWNEYVDQVDALIRTGRFSSRYDAGQEVRRRFPRLANVQVPGTTGKQPQRAVGGEGAASASYTDAEAELDKRARKISAEENVSYAQGYVLAMRRDPAIYLAFLRQHQRRLAEQEAARRG